MMNTMKKAGLAVLFAGANACAPALQSTVDINTASVKLKMSDNSEMVTNCGAKETSVYVNKELVSQKPFSAATENGKIYQTYACEQLAEAKAAKVAAKLAIK